MTISHPPKILVPVETALREWGNDGAIYQEKLDGEFAVREVRGGVLAGEFFKKRAAFIAFDILRYLDSDVASLPLSDRQWMRDEICRRNLIQTVPTFGNGSLALEYVLRNGGEGVVRKLPTSSYFEPMLAAKRGGIWTCRVAGIGPGQSITVCDSETGQARGKVPAKGGAADVLKLGDLVRIEAACIHPSGLFREAKLCREYRVKA